MENSNLKKNMLWNAAGNVIYLACQWVVTILVTNLGDFTDAGILSLAMSISATFHTIGMFGIRNFQVSDVENKYSDTTYVNFRVITGTAAMAGCMIFSVICRHSGTTLLAIFLYMLFHLSECLSDVLHGIAQKNDRLDIAGKAYALKGVSTLSAFFIAYKLTLNINIGLLAFTSAAWILTIVYDVVSVKGLSDFGFCQKIGNSMKLAKETWPLCVYLFFVGAISTVPKLILESILGEEILGIYSSIFSPALIIAAAAGYLFYPFVPAFAEHYKKKDSKAFIFLFAKITFAIVGFFVVTVILAVFLGDFALGIIFGEKIADHTYLLLPIIIAIFANALMSFLCTLSVVLRDFISLIISCIAGLLLELAITGAWINHSGINAASYSYICGSVLVCIALLARIVYILFLKKERQIDNDI